MTRAAFLSAGGDPFIASLAMRLWKERWYDEVDKFYVSYNNHADVPLSVAQEFISKAMEDPKVQIIYHPRGIGNGMPITEMTQIAKEELCMLLEDDGFIFGSGIVNECFQRIEKDQCDAVGSPRGSCGKEIWDAAGRKYGLDYSGYGDVGPNYWPNFFFAKVADMRKTDMDFGSHTWKPGEYSPELNHTFTEINHGDTFVWGCVQLRALGIRFSHIPQWHASPEEIEFKERKEEKWADGANPRWIHGGSLSAGWGGYLTHKLPDVSTLQAKMEIESRVAWWRIAMESTEGYTAFKRDYFDGIEYLMEKADLSTERVQAKYNMYKALLGV